MVETLSNLVSHANATIQLNALWGLMVSEGRRQEREGGSRKNGQWDREERKEGGEEQEWPKELGYVVSCTLVCSVCLQRVAYDSGGDVKSRIKQSLGLKTLFECVTKILCACPL